MLGQTRQIRVLRTLGEGGFGAVYLAEIAGPDGFVQRAALKVLHKAMAGHEDIAGRQRDEARLLAQLNHDHIVKVLDLGDYDGRPAVLMEYVDGIDTHGLLQQGALPPRVVMEIVAAVASALDAASSATSPSTGKPLRVVHRDIKPANLLVTAQGGVKVLDFGVARADFDREGATKSVLFGTARFMAPEMWLEGSSSPAVDVYALGVTALELLGAGTYARPPLHSALYEKHVEGALAPLSLETNPGWTEEIRGLIRSMLAYEKGDRPSAGQVHDRASELAERAPGLPLRRWARQVVPPLLAERATRAVAVTPPPAPADTRFTPVSPNKAGDGDAPRPAVMPVPLNETAPVRAVERNEGPVDEESEPVVIDASASVEVPVEEVRSARHERPASRAPRLTAAAGLIVAVGAGAVWYGSDSGSEGQPPMPEPTVAPAEPSPLEDVNPPSEVPVSSDPAPADAPEAISPRASPQRTPVTSRAQTPPVESAMETPAPEPAATLSCATGRGRVPVNFSSSPLGAEVWVNGARLGTTPLSNCALPEGQYTVTMRTDSHSTSHDLRVSSRASSSFIWDVASDRWKVGE